MDRRIGALVLAMMVVAGCTLNRAELRKETVLTRIGGPGGQLIEPKRCVLEVAILSRPLRDEAINEAVWSAADEQVIAPSARHALGINGVRIGRITGDLPAAVEALLQAPPPHKVEPMQIVLPDGDHTLVSLSDSVPRASLLLNRDGAASGKDYTDASGWLRVTAEQEGATGVRLRIAPEIHHGPMQRAFGALPSGGTMAPQQFMQRDGQQEDTLRDLSATLSLEPGQVGVIGCRAEAARSLGAFLFTRAEANSDRLLQRLVLVWASRTNLGAPGTHPTTPPHLEPVEPPTCPWKPGSPAPPGRWPTTDGEWIRREEAPRRSRHSSFPCPAWGRPCGRSASEWATQSVEECTPTRSAMHYPQVRSIRPGCS